VPESISSSRHPVGIVVSPGTTRTTSSPLWAFLWTIEADPDSNEEPPKRQPRPADPE
jgi:hypothetical protein